MDGLDIYVVYYGFSIAKTRWATTNTGLKKRLNAGCKVGALVDNISVNQRAF